MTPSTDIVHSSCRLCAGMCGLLVERDAGGHIVTARGDKANPLTRGYACLKGLQLPAAHRSPDRLLHSRKRLPDGRFVDIPVDEALDEIAARLAVVLDRHGPDAVAGFRGTMNYCNQTANAMLPAWLQALGSTSLFSTMTIDQSAKWVTADRLGTWAAGKDAFASADVLMFIGTNPLVSLSTFNFPSQHPAFQMREALERGTRFIVIDPRRSETAQHAEVFLQPHPGEDAALLAGLLRIVLDEGWHDAVFCSRHVDGLAALREALAPFDAARVATRCGVPAAQLRAAAALFAQPLPGRRKRGSAASGTGANMGPHSNLVEHLVETLNVVCGRFLRAGDPVPHPGVLAPWPRQARVQPPTRGWERGPHSRVGGYGRLFGQKLSGVLAQEITTPGDGQVHALVVDGGNPALTVPDAARIAQALGSLDLLVTIDPFMTATARLSHYIIAPKMLFEREDMPTRDYEPYVLHVPYTQYSEAVAQPPAGAEVVDEWFVYWDLARRLGRTIVFDGVPLDMTRRPATEDLLRLLARHSPVPFETLRRCTAGAVLDRPPVQVEPAPPDDDARFQVAPPDVRQALATVAAEAPLLQRACSPGFSPTHLLTTRRLRDVQNSMFRQLEAVAHRWPDNPLWLHPQDLAALGVAPGARVQVRSAHGRIEVTVAADACLRPGTAALAPGFGTLPGQPPGTGHDGGVNANRLTTTAVSLQPINAMPWMTALPVVIERQAQPMAVAPPAEADRSVDSHTERRSE